jgi:hypothetical protein
LEINHLRIYLFNKENSLKWFAEIDKNEQNKNATTTQTILDNPARLLYLGDETPHTRQNDASATFIDVLYLYTVSIHRLYPSTSSINVTVTVSQPLPP